MRRSIYAGLAAFAVTLIVSHLRSTPYNNYVLLADAFLHGHAWIDVPGNYIDALPYNGRHYVIEAPLPAVLLLPFVAVFGKAANQTFLAVVLCAVSIGTAWEICERLRLAPARSIWLCGFLLAGTDLLWCAMLGDVWFLAHVSAVCLTLLALAELLGKKRGWLVALWAVCAVESRFSMAAAVPVYIYLLRIDTSDEERAQGTAGQRWRAFVSFGMVMLASSALWAAYNEVRWGTIADIGYTQWYHQDAAGMPAGSPFQLTYLPYELQSFFVALPEFTRDAPFVIPGINGVALTWTSPALILAAFARRPRRLVLALWAAAVLTAAPNFLYYVNGFAQFGMRHALDFVPFLFVLMVLAARNALPIWARALMAYSIAVGLWGCWFWNAFVRTRF